MTRPLPPVRVRRARAAPIRPAAAALDPRPVRVSDLVLAVLGVALLGGLGLLAVSVLAGAALP